MVFIDDILVYLHSIGEHAQHLKIMFQVLHEKQLYTKMSKCELLIDRVVLLGHVISKEDISVDPSKIDAIFNWSCPTTVAGIHSFWGWACYYHCFIMNFSQISRPLSQLTWKVVHFSWSAE